MTVYTFIRDSLQAKRNIPSKWNSEELSSHMRYSIITDLKYFLNKIIFLNCVCIRIK